MVTLRNHAPEASSRAAPRRRLDGIVAHLPRARAMLVLALAVLTLNVLTSNGNREVSAVDEREHIDHLIRTSQGDVPQGGETLTQETLRELCTRGSEYIEWPDCRRGRLDPSDFAVGGDNAAGDRPFYYLVTAPAARLLRALTPGWESLVTWGRVLGAAWLLLGMYLALRAGDALEVPRWPLVAALVLVAAVPVQLAASTTVTPDATGFATGAALLVAALWWDRTGRGLWLLPILGVAAVLFEPTNALGAFVVLTYLAVRAVTGQEWRRYAIAALAVTASVGVGLVGWERVEELRDPPDQHAYTQEEIESVDQLDPLREGATDEQGLTAKRVFGGGALFAMFPPVTEIAPPTSRSTGDNAPWYQAFSFAALFLMVGALLLSVLRPTPEERSSALGLATTVALIAGSVLMVLARYNLYDTYDPVVARFGLSALPAIALVLAMAARERLAQWILVVAAAGLYATALLTLV